MVEKIETISPIPKEIINKFIQTICKDVTSQMHLNFNYSNVDDIKKSLIFTNNIAESEKVHALLMNKCANELGPFIEKETGIDRNKWNRSITLFESVVEQNHVSLFW